MASPSRSPLTLDDLIADLVWPKLLRVGRLALRPARIGLGAMYLVGCAAIVGAASWIDGDAERNVLADAGIRAWLGLQTTVGGVLRWDIAGISDGLRRAFVSVPLAAFRAGPAAVILGLPLLLIWTVLIGGSISRLAGTELTIHRTTSWPEGVALCLRRWKSLLAAAAIPIAILWILLLGMAIAGWVLFSLRFVNVLGGLMWGLFLLGGLVGTILLIGAVLGQGLVTPGVVCEGSDSIDAVQHAYSMSLGRPLRLLLYVGILAIQGVVFCTIVLLLIRMSVDLSQNAASAWSGERGRAVIGAASSMSGEIAAKPAADGVANYFVFLWTEIFRMLGRGAIVSYVWCAATALFLTMRRVCDGQEMSELWSPGFVPGTTTPSLQTGEVAGGTRSEAVIDNGAADEG